MAKELQFWIFLVLYGSNAYYGPDDGASLACEYVCKRDGHIYTSVVQLPNHIQGVWISNGESWDPTQNVFVVKQIDFDLALGSCENQESILMKSNKNILQYQHQDPNSMSCKIIPKANIKTKFDYSRKWVSNHRVTTLKELEDDKYGQSHELYQNLVKLSRENPSLNLLSDPCNN
jgi:hypothetical protein